MVELISNSSTYRRENLTDMLSWSLDKKINHSLKRIREFYESQSGQVYISFSGGKDSTVLLHLVRSLYPNVVAVFSNTTNEFLEILDFVKQTDNVITLYPKISFNETVEKFGFPLVSKKTARSITDLRENKPETSNVRNLYLTGLNRQGFYSPTYKLSKKWYPLFESAEFNITSKCCDILKKEPMHRFEKETKLKGFIGTQTSEGTLRKTTWIATGCNTYDGSNIKSRPLSIWTETDIWEYINRFNIAYSKIYDDIKDDFGNVLVEGEKRTGCAFCAYGAHLEKSDLVSKNRFQRLALRKPKQYKKMMLLENNGVSFSQALFYIGVKN